MNGPTRVERRLPEILADLGAGPAPDYTDSLLARTAATRQRPGWAFPKRWLPMTALAERTATAPRVPWRVIAVVALLVIALAAAVLYVGSHQRHVPAPFGPAKNGLIAYGAAGDIFLGDPSTGNSRLLVGGAESDHDPGFSPDGTRVAFLRDTAGSGVDLYVVDPDGSHLTRVTSNPGGKFVSVNWVPDGRLGVIREVAPGQNRLDLYDASGGGTPKTVLTATGTDGFTFRPPDGREFLYRALVDGKWGLFAMSADGTSQRTIVQPTVDASVDRTFSMATWSADGSRIFYEWGPTNDRCCRLWVVNADGNGAHEFVPPATDAWDGQATVSPDGTWVAYWHNPNDGPAHGVSVVRADGSGSVRDLGPNLPRGASYAWSPDSSRLLVLPDDGPSTPYLLDPAAGTFTTLPWPVDGLDWQRLADS